MTNKIGLGFWRRPDRKAMRKSFKRQYYTLSTLTVLIIASLSLLPLCTYAFGSSNRRPPQQPANGNRPGPPPPPHHQSIRRQGLPFEGGAQNNNNNNNNNSPPVGHRRIQNGPHPHGPPPHHTKHRRPPFPFPRRRPPPPPPRGRGPPPPRDREREQENNRGRPPFNKQHQNNNNNNNNNFNNNNNNNHHNNNFNNNNNFQEGPSKLSFHIPPPPITTPAPHQHQMHDGLQQRPHSNNPGVSESNFQQFQNLPQPTLNQFQPNNQNQNFQPQFQQGQGQYPPQQNNPQLSPNNPQQFPPQQFQQQNNGNLFQNQQPNFFNQNFQQNQQPSPIPPNSFSPSPSNVPPTVFQPGPPLPTNGFQQGLPQFQQNGFEQGMPPVNVNPSQMPPFNNNPQFQPPQQPMFGQINLPSPSSLPPPHSPNNPPILEYAPPPNTFQSNQRENNLLQDKSKEIELNSIPKQTITFTVTPKPSKAGGTQLHFKISTPKPFKTTLKPITNSKGYFKGSTYRPPVDKLNSKFKYTSSSAGYPDTEYRVQDGSRRDSSMSAEMEPPQHHPDSIKDLLLNREHSLNQPAQPHPDDTDNYAGPSYDSPPVFMKPYSGEEVLIAGVSTGKKNYHKGEQHDDSPLRGPSPGPPYDEDYDNGQQHDNDELGSKSYSDRHLHSYGGAKDNHFDEFGKFNDEHFRRPSHSGSHEEPYDEYNQRNNRPSIHIDEESLSGEKSGKFSQPDPLYHPEDDAGSGSKERDNGGELGEPAGPARYDNFGFGGSAERRHKDKDFHHQKDTSSKSTAEELLAALGLSTNPLVSMSSNKYPVEIPTKYSKPGSWERERDYPVDSKRTKASGGEPLGLLEYLNQKQESSPSSPHSTEPLFSVPDRPIGGSGENSFVVKGSMKTGGSADPTPEVGKATTGNVILGRPIPQYQGTEQDIITSQNPLAQQTSYIEHKVKAHDHPASGSSTGQESYLFEKLHGGHHHKVESGGHLPIINQGLYGPSVPPPISEPGSFTNNPPGVLSSVAPVLSHHQVHTPQVPSLISIQPKPQPAGTESYLYQKIHGNQGAPSLTPGLAFGPTPTSPHSVEDLSQPGLYNSPQIHPQSGLYAAPSEQVTAASGPASPGMIYPNGKIISPQQQQTIGNGILLPLGMGGGNVPGGLSSANTIPVQGVQQTAPSQQFTHVHQQPLQQQPALQQQQPQQLQHPQMVQHQAGILQQQHLLPQQSVPQPTVLLPQQTQTVQTQHQPQQTIMTHQQQQQRPILSQPQQPGAVFQTAMNSASLLPQQQPQGQQSQHVPQIVPAPTASQQPGNLYGSVASESIDRSAQLPSQQSAEVGHHSHHPQPGHPNQYQPYPQNHQYLQQQVPSQTLIAGHPHQPYSPQGALYGPNQYNQFSQQPLDPSLASSTLQQKILPQQPFPAGSAHSAVTARYPEAYPIYVTEPDPIIEIIVQDSNMTLPAMPTLPPPPPPPPPTPEPVHVFYVKYSQKNNTPVFDNYYGQSNHHIQLEQPISSVPVRGPDRNGMLPVDDGQDSMPQSSIQHQNIYNALYTSSPEPGISTTPAPSTTTTLRTIIRPDRNEFSQGGSGLVVSFDNPAVEHEIFANYTNGYMQQQQQLQQQQQQQHNDPSAGMHMHHQPPQQHQQPQEQQQQQYQQQQQPHAYPEITFPAQPNYPQHYGHHQQQPEHHHHQQPQQQQYPPLDSLWAGITAEHKNVDPSSMTQPQDHAYQNFNKRIGLQELASLLEAGPPEQQDERKPQDHQPTHPQQDYHNMQHQPQNPYGQNDEHNPPPLYQYVESQHPSNINTRQAKLPEDVPEELRNQLVQSGILGNAEVQVINYSENLFKELGELPPEALAAFHAHTGHDGSNKQLESGPAHPSASEQSVWSGSQVNLANADLSSILPSGRSLRSILVVKNSLRPKRGGRQRRVVLLITDKDDVLLYRPKDRSLKRIGDTTSNPVIRGAIELSNHRMDSEETSANQQSV